MKPQEQLTASSGAVRQQDGSRRTCTAQDAGCRMGRLKWNQT